MKPVRGEVWRNVHSGQDFVIAFRLFFNVAYFPMYEVQKGEPRYTHYKTFAKDFVRVTEIACSD